MLFMMHLVPRLLEPETVYGFSRFETDITTSEWHPGGFPHRKKILVPHRSSRPFRAAAETSMALLPCSAQTKQVKEKVKDEYIPKSFKNYFYVQEAKQINKNSLNSKLLY